MKDQSLPNNIKASLPDKQQELEQLENQPQQEKGENGQNPDQIQQESQKIKMSEYIKQHQKKSMQVCESIELEQEKKNKSCRNSAWQASWHYRIIQYWQSIFNRRIVSFSCFALQVGDVFIFCGLLCFLCISCVSIKKSKSSGNMASITMAATIVFGCRNGFLSYLFGLSLERALLWHQFLAWITLGMSINHWVHSKSIASGFIVQVPLMAFIVFSIKPIRRYLWELFMKMHWILIIVMIVGCIAHGVTYALFALGYFALDVVYRGYTVYQLRNISNQMKLERIGTNITKISISNKNNKYKGGQYYFIMIPKLGYLQWHPFSVFSASYEEEIVFYVKCLGDWTTQLYQIAGEQGKPTIFKGYLDGPYGYHSISIEGDKYKNFLCISGGIGVTPIISTAKELLHQIEQGRPINSLYFIWTGRDSAIVQSVLKPDDLRSLLNQDDATILQNFYHYSDKGDKKIDDLEKQAQIEQHQLVVLAKGRPDFNKYFEAAFNSAKAKGDHLVGVLTCGPQQLIDAAEINSMKWSKDGIRFDCHQEVFDF
ncbi:ferric reductase-like transmembrane component family protein (macronuclear) [Tetrahymena thermophila SB210]|uniref:Ferric reductase-like transmembrane component family protein n=1 Tax=Tetrahymena thermophila (strain SB210) TaxID=312017 RepID=A4VE03_TETTS|nr:ferric reductase-like transmembrane component family protein [Tetrahymena thermophila SB210]EDK31756.1 ferric reductase-like transmembrane component family protein [Tetrahymena thermophila SB210]|eukprot:XP_001470774.1 ferric reductase-like transmembrane component family protein [Tetrahymena thermophila SB210]